jgi:hypothetical protein
LHRTVQRLLEDLPLGLVNYELATTICQRLRGRRHACVEQELTDVLVAGACSFLQQLLDWRACTNVPPMLQRVAGRLLRGVAGLNDRVF